MTLTTSNGKQGFTLVEILIVIAILGVIMGAVYSVYLVHQKSAYTQEEVVDLQQNLRIAMESISRDIRMAGMLVPVASPPVASGFANYSTSVTLNTASAKGVYARINAAPTVTAGTDVTCTVESAAAVDLFDANSGNPVKLIRPVDGSQPFNTTFTVTASDRTAPSLTLRRGTGNFVSGDVIKRGDMIAMSYTGAPNPDNNPNTIAYSVVSGGTCPQNQSCIARKENGAAEIIANYVSSLKFDYILDDSSETNNPSDLTKVRAVRVTITGRTSSTSVLSGGPKTRQLTSVVKIRNRRL